MSELFSFRFVLALIVGLLLMWHIYDDEKTLFSTEPNIYAYGCLLLVYLLALSLAFLLADEWDRAWNQILTMWFDTFLSISLYYCLIVFLISPLRKYIRARTCALLWVIPNYLHFLQRPNMNLEQEKPLLILSLPYNVAPHLFILWGTGCLLILGYHVVMHLRFRKWLLQKSQPIVDKDIMNIWAEEKQDLYLQDKSIALAVSPRTATPLSIGLLDRSICVVLPQKDYTEEELRLIFRHELTHIARKDSFTKLFLILCSALCWFNPLMWFAIKRSAEDIELSCDEHVLREESSSVRKQYAGLLLSTAGDQRGFTTCLSASASSMTYRLKNIIHPRKKTRGGWIAALVFLLLALSCGQISLAYARESGEHIIFPGAAPSEYEFRTVSLPTENHHSTLSCRDTEALAEYLSGLTLDRITGNYELSQYDRTLYLLLIQGDTRQVVTIKDQFMIVTPILQRGHHESIFRISENVDWPYLESLMEYGPNLRLHFETSEGVKTATASVYNLDRIENGAVVPIRRGSEATDISSLLDGTTKTITMDFSYPPIEPYTVTIENWEKTEKTVFTQDLLNNPDTIPLLYPHAHYTVQAKLDAGNGYCYNAEFRFDCYDFILEK